MSSAEHSRTILIVSYDFPPRSVHSAARTAAIATTLANSGWRVITVCCAPDGTVPRDEVWAAQLEAQGVEIVRTKTLTRVEVQVDGSIKTPPPFLSAMRRWLRQWSLQPDIYVAWRKEALRCIEEVLASTSVNMLYAAAPPFSDFTLVQDIAEQHAIPFAVDYGDRWLGNPLHSLPTPMHRNRSEAMEESVLRKAAMIFTTTRRMKEDLLRRFRYLTHEEILIVPHGYDAGEFEHLSAEPHEGCFITAYQDFHGVDSPQPLLKALKLLLAKRPELRGRVVVQFIGPMREKHRHLIKKWKLQDIVRTHAFLDRPRALSVLVNSDLLCCLAGQDSPAASAVVGDYLGARKPLLVCAPEGTIVSTAKELAPTYHAPYSQVKLIVPVLERAIDDQLSRRPVAPTFHKSSSCNYAVNGREVSRVLGMAMKMV